MLGSVGLWRAVANRTGRDWAVVLAAWLLVLLAASLLAAGALYGDAVAHGGLRRTLLAAPPADRSLVARATVVPSAIAPLDAAIEPELRRGLGAPGGEVALVVASGVFAAADADSDAVRDLVSFAAFEGIEAHATLRAGWWPDGLPDAATGTVDVAISEAAAAALGLALGDELRLVARSAPSGEVAARVVGVWDPIDRDDAYWLGSSLALDGEASAGRFTERGPLVVAHEAVASGVLGARVQVEWRALPALDQLRVDQLEGFRLDALAADRRVAAAVPPGSQVRVATGLPALLGEVGSTVVVGRGGVLLLTAQFAVLAAYAILLVAGMLVERRRAEVALLRSRGASAGHVVAMALGEALVLAGLAMLAAPWLALGVVRFLVATGPLGAAGLGSEVVITPAPVAVAAATALGGALALTAPVLLGGANPAGIRAAGARQSGRTLAQRIGIDLALVVLAGVALWQLRLYGAPITRNARGVLGVDPLLVAAPAIGLLAGAVLATRVVPRVAEIAERLLERHPGFVGVLGGRQLARRPLRYTRSALLLVLAVALGTFAAAHDATWTRSQADQAAYRAAADVRVTTGGELPSHAVGSTLAAVDGVREATPVALSSVDAGRALRGGRLLAVDPEALRRLAWQPPGDRGTVDAALATLVAARPSSAAIALPADTDRLALTLAMNLRPEPGVPDAPALPADWEGIEVAAVIEDADGLLHRFAGDRGGLVGDSLRLEIPLASTAGGESVRPATQPRLHGLELTLTAPPGSVVVGTVDLVALEAGSAAGGERTPVGLDPAAPGWRWTLAGADAGRAVDFIAAEDPERIEIGLEPGRFPPLFGRASGDLPGGAGRPTFRLLADPASPPPVAAIVSRSFLAATGARVGETLGASLGGARAELELVAAVDAFAPLEPDVPFAVVDGRSLGYARFGATGGTVEPQEWWLAVDPARSAEVAATLRAEPIGATEVVARDELERSLTTDPIPLGVIGVLGLGSFAAMLFAAIGFLVSAALSTSERLGELAILRALGLSARQLSAWLAIENVFLVALGLAGGTLLGGLLAWLVLPFATLTVSGAAPVPAPAVVVPWDALVPVYVLGALLLAATIVVLRASLPAVRVADVLRARDD